MSVVATVLLYLAIGFVLLAALTPPRGRAERPIRGRFAVASALASVSSVLLRLLA